MSGRGGGRNARPAGGVSVLANALGIQRGEIINQSVSQPPPLFPPLDFKPLPLSSSEDHNYMVALKNEFLNRMRESAYFLKEPEPKKDIVRYSDKYRKVAVEPWTPYYDRLPKELWPKHLLPEAEGGVASSSSTRGSTKRRKVDGKSDTKFAKKLEVLEKREMRRKSADAEDEGEEEKQKKKNADDAEEEETEAKEDEQELSDEDYQEEDNDYIQNYFDNGDNYLDDSEDNADDEAYY